jgi:hypothetical protein
MNYEQSHTRLCKVCNSGFVDVIDFQHYFRQLSYDNIVAYWPELHLNLSNLTNHFNCRSAELFKQFWASLKHRAKRENLTDDQILDEVRAFYE